MKITIHTFESRTCTHTHTHTHTHIYIYIYIYPSTSVISHRHSRFYASKHKERTETDSRRYYDKKNTNEIFGTYIFSSFFFLPSATAFYP